MTAHLQLAATRRRFLAGAQALPPGPVAEAARIVRTFIEDYHEKLKEELLSPRFRKADTLVALVDVLEAPHAARPSCRRAHLRHPGRAQAHRFQPR
jgi:hypothetical protein